MTDTNLTRNFRDGALTLYDNTTTPETLEIPYCEGDFSYTETEEFINILDRGVLDHVRQGNQVPVSWSFSFKFREWKADSGASPSPIDCMKQRNEASAWVSVAQDGEPYAFGMTYEVANPDSNGKKETLTFDKCRAAEVAYEDGEEYNVVKASGTAFITTPASARAAQS